MAGVRPQSLRLANFKERKEKGKRSLLLPEFLERSRDQVGGIKRLEFFAVNTQKKN